MDLYDITWAENFQRFEGFLAENPQVKWLRLQYLDVCGILRLRIVPTQRAQALYKRKSFTRMPKGPLVLLPNDIPSPEFSAYGDYVLYPDFKSLRLGASEAYATVQCELRELNLDEVDRCPRTVLKRVVNNAAQHGLSFLIGFEIEVMFLVASSPQGVNEDLAFDVPQPKSQSHGYSSATPFHNPDTMSLLEDILARLETSEIQVEQWHAEGAADQFEFCLPPEAPIAAIDTLLAARDIIATAAATHGRRATLHPKPFPDRLGSGAHIHFSMNPPEKANKIIAGMLKHMQAIMAFTYSKAASYDRILDSMLAGSRYICWGTMNRETTIRFIEDSHYEFRCADGFANMYLVVAALISAGTLGVVKDEQLAQKDCQEDPAQLGVQGRNKLGIGTLLPKDIDEALMKLEADEDFRSALGHEMARCYASVKRGEVEMFRGMEDVQRKNLLIERY